MSLRTLVRSSPAEVGRAAAAAVLEGLERTGHRVLGLATGSSPQPLYAALAEQVRGGLDLADVEAFALDEYVGLPAEHPQSYHRVIARDATAPLRLDPSRVHVPHGQAADPAAAALRYEAALAAAGGVGVQILGLGTNGHIGFNEPGSAPDSRTRVVALAPATRQANSRFFASLDEVPTHALTQGVGTILTARSLVLVATGAAKAEAVRRTVEGRPDPRCPGSLLQGHDDVLLVLDEAAAALLGASSRRGLTRPACAAVSASPARWDLVLHGTTPLVSQVLRGLGRCGDGGG